LKACRTEPPSPPTFAEVWTVIGVLTGLRPSEQRGLPIEDLELDGKRPGFPVRIRADKWQVIGPVKTGRSRRWIPIGPAAVALLRRWLLVVPRGNGFDDPEREGRTLHPLFPTSDGTVQSLANIHNRTWTPLLNAATLALPPSEKEIALAKVEKRAPLGKPIYSINCRRHLAASIRIDEGWDVKRVADFLGHSSPVVTLRMYAHLFRMRERQQDDAARSRSSCSAEPLFTWNNL
jgi:integrase